MSKRLSVCMIVKNEEKNIARCLDSIVGIADEIIVVDTGSTDNTKEIAKSYNSKLYDFEWVDDFSKARNFSIEQATGDWILILDGDDMFERNDALKLRAITDSQDSADVYIFNTICYVGNRAGTDKIMNVNLRLFKNIPELRYKGKIHESIVSTNRKVTMKTSDINIYHYGYLNSNIVEQKKRERNMRILESQLEEDSENPYFLFCMGNEYFALNNMSKALEYFLSSYSKCNIYDIYVPKLIIRIIMTYQSMQDYENALKYITEALNYYPEYTDVEYIRGTIYHRLGNYSRAIGSFQRCLQMGEPAAALNFIIGVGSYRAYHALGSIFHQMGDYDEALKNLNQAILSKSDYYDAVYAIGSIMVKIYGNSNEIRKHFEQFFNMSNDGNLILMADVMFLEKQYELALEYINKALKTDSNLYNMQYLKARSLYNLKRYEESIAVLEDIGEESPFYLNALTSIVVCYLITDNYDKIYDILNRLGNVSGATKVHETLVCLTGIICNSNKKILAEDSEESNEYLPIIVDLLNMFMCVNEFDKFEKALELFNCIENDTVLLELAKLYDKYGLKQMAAKEVIRSIKIYEKLDEKAAFILYKSFLNH